MLYAKIDKDGKLLDFGATISLGTGIGEERRYSAVQERQAGVKIVRCLMGDAYTAAESMANALEEWFKEKALRENIQVPIDSTPETRIDIFGPRLEGAKAANTLMEEALEQWQNIQQ